MTEDEQRQKRGEATRAALIQAGLELFGEHGFQATTTRMLVDHAGANISAIPYYFGGKRGLYHAVLQHIIGRVSQIQQAQGFDPAKAAQLDLLTPELALGLLRQLFATFAKLFVDYEESRQWVQVIIREQARPTEGFDILYNQHISVQQRMITRLIGICTGLDPDSDEVKIRSHALFGQAMGFMIAREALLRMLGVRKLTEKHVAMIERVVSAHAAACLQIPELAADGGA